MAVEFGFRGLGVAFRVQRLAFVALFAYRESGVVQTPLRCFGAQGLGLEFKVQC